MFCENCGNKVEDGVKICPACGCEIANAAAPAADPQVITVGDQVEPTPVDNAEVQKKVKTFGTIGIVCGVVALLFSFLTLFLALPFAVVGIVFSVLGFMEAKKAGVDNKLCLIGLIVSIAGPIVGFIISFVIGFIIGLIFSIAA